MVACMWKCTPKMASFQSLRNTQIGVENVWLTGGVAVTIEGHIAVVCRQQEQWKVLIV